MCVYVFLIICGKRVWKHRTRKKLDTMCIYFDLITDYFDCLVFFFFFLTIWDFFIYILHSVLFVLVGTCSCRLLFSSSVICCGGEFWWMVWIWYFFCSCVSFILYIKCVEWLKISMRKMIAPPIRCLFVDIWMLTHTEVEYSLIAHFHDFIFMIWLSLRADFSKFSFWNVFV